MNPEERFRIVRSVGEECIQEDELLNLLTKKPQPICYDGFEPSGRMHIAQVLHFVLKFLPFKLHSSTQNWNFKFEGQLYNADFPFSVFFMLLQRTGCHEDHKREQIDFCWL